MSIYGSRYEVVQGYSGKKKLYHLKDDGIGDVKTVEIATFESALHADIICRLMNEYDKEATKLVTQNDFHDESHSWLIDKGEE